MKSLKEQILNETATLHKLAERGGFNTVLMQGKATREMYGKYLLHKYHIYSALEDSLNKNKNIEVIQNFIFPELERTPTIKNDMDFFIKGWQNQAMLSSVKSYVYHMIRLADNEPILLIAHAYNIYLAELSGGQIIKTILKKQYQFKDEELHTYEFDNINNTSEFKEEYHKRLEKYFGEHELKKDFIEEIKLSYIYSIASLLELIEN